MRTSVVVLSSLLLVACGDGGSPGGDDDVGPDIATDTPASDGSGEDVVDEDAPPEDVAADAPADTETPDVVDTGGRDAAADTSPDTDGGAPEDADTPDAGPTPLSCSDIEAVEYDGATLAAPDVEAIALDVSAFDMGVQAGAARAESVLLWTHIADGEDKRLWVWRDGGESDVVAVDRAITPGVGGYTHVPVDGLAPCTWYSYAFVAVDEVGAPTGRSRIGRFKTAHPPGSRDSVLVGATSCTNFSYQPWRALELTAAEGADLLFHLGDQSYNDDAESLAEYRATWRRALTDPGYLAFHGSASHLTTWDDHEVDNDWDPETFPDARRINATNAYFETLAVERGPENRLWNSYQWGDTLEVFVTDNRGERRPSTRTEDDAQYISPEQMTWLQDGLLNSTAHFKVVFSSVPITNMPNLWDVAAGDRWEGYEADRDRLLDFIIDNELENVWFVGGDFHVGFAGRIEPDGPRSAMWEIAAGPGGNGPNPLALQLNEPQFDFKTDGFGAAFMTTLEFDPERDAVRVMFVEGDGELIYDKWLRWGVPE